MLWRACCADFEELGRRGQLQFAQTRRSWYGGRERGDWTQQMDLTNTERGQLRPTTDAARSGFRDREKMLSDSARASSITAPVCLSAGWLWRKRESEGRQKRGSRVPQEGDFKNKGGKERNKTEGEKNTPFHWHVCLAAGPTNAPSYLPSARPLRSLFPSRSHPSLSSLHPFIVCPMIPPSFHPSFMDSWM